MIVCCLEEQMRSLFVQCHLYRWRLILEEDTLRTPPRSGDMKQPSVQNTEDAESEGSTGALKSSDMPPILDKKGSPDLGKRR
jgi:hypothetical protein